MNERSFFIRNTLIAALIPLHFFASFVHLNEKNLIDADAAMLFLLENSSTGSVSHASQGSAKTRNNDGVGNGVIPKCHRASLFGTLARS
jgi:hypothetical protein